MTVKTGVRADHPETGNAAYTYDDGSQVSYVLEETNVTLAGREEQPSHELRCYNPERKKAAGTTYYVRVEGDDIHFISERAGSARKYSKRKMFSPRHRAILEADGYTLHDPTENIRLETVSRVEDWLADQGVDPDSVDVRVSAQHQSVTISTRGYLDGDPWDQYIETMRAHEELQWADTQQVWYVSDEDVPALLEDEP